MSLEQFGLVGRVAVVTGGSRGLGKAIALALAGAGADVAVASRQLDTLEAAAAEIAQATGRRALAVRADVTQEADVDALLATARAELGPIDILVNNAGINLRGPIEALTPAQWHETLATNLTGPWLACRAVVPEMKARRRGRIINVGSTVSLVGIAGRSAYAASKGGLAQLTKVLALELAPFGVTCNAICPGPFATELNTRLLADPEVAATFTARVPLGRWGEPREIGGAAIFLASEASSFVTGTTLLVDGGWTAQ